MAIDNNFCIHTQHSRKHTCTHKRVCARTHTHTVRGRSEVHYCSAARWLPLSLPGPSPVGGCDSCNAGCSAGSSHHGMESRTGCGSVSIWEKQREGEGEGEGEEGEGREWEGGRKRKEEGREGLSTLATLKKDTEHTHMHGLADATTIAGGIPALPCSNRPTLATTGSDFIPACMQHHACAATPTSSSVVNGTWTWSSVALETGSGNSCSSSPCVWKWAGGERCPVRENAGQQVKEVVLSYKGGC